jgi:hypothetical protein
MADARWSTLIDFVGRWYREPIVLPETVDAGLLRVGPPALRTWFSLVKDRLDGRGRFTFPDPLVFSRWPRLAGRKPELHESDVGRGLIPVVRVGGHRGWGIHREDPDEDPRVHLLELEDSPSESFSGPLSALLTNALIWETIEHGRDQAGPLGPLAAGVRRATLDSPGPAAREFVLRPLLQPVRGWTLEGARILADPEQTTLVLDDGGPAHVLTRTEAAWVDLQAHLRRDVATLDELREQQRRRYAEERGRGRP